MIKKTVEITISTDFVTLGQLLKIADVISSGGEAKSFLSSHKILVDGVSDNRRGRKLRDSTVVEIGEVGYRIIKK